MGSNNVEPACQTNKDQRTSYTTSTLTQEVLPQEATHADDEVQILMIGSHVHDGSYPKASNFHKSHNPTYVQQLDFITEEDRTSGEDLLIKIVQKENLVEQQRSVYCIHCNKTFKGPRSLAVH